MKKYIKPEIEMIKSEVKDIILASYESADVDGGIVSFLQEWLNS